VLPVRISSCQLISNSAHLLVWMMLSALMQD